jgi:hypothetical protein
MSNETKNTKETQETAIMNTETNMQPATSTTEPIYGFEDSNASDIVIPRIKVINALSPERQDGIANEGDIINSLTKESVADKAFIPIKHFYSKIKWNPDRDADQRIICMSRDGKIGVDGDNVKHACASCKDCLFDNTKTGKDSQPLCTSYMNFLGFFEGDPMPVVLSFAKTNYNEGKKMLSIAKAMRCNIWDYSYLLAGKKVSKGRNSWYNISATRGPATSAEDRQLAKELYDVYAKIAINADYEDVATLDSSSVPADAEIAAEI